MESYLSDGMVNNTAMTQKPRTLDHICMVTNNGGILCLPVIIVTKDAFPILLVNA